MRFSDKPVLDKPGVTALLIRGTYYQDRFMYCMYRRGQNAEKYILSNT